jgi:hypothetical protein
MSGCFQWGLTRSVLPKEFEGLSWTVLHITTVDYKTVSAITWASRSVMQEALELHYGRQLQKLEQIIAEGLDHPAQLHDVDGEFQYWACHKLAAGGTWPVAKYKEDMHWENDGDLQLSNRKVQLVSRIPSVSTMVQQHGHLHYSTLANERLCDAAMVDGATLFLFQMTIGKTHNFNQRRWSEFCTEALGARLTCVRFIYVIPHKDRFSIPQEQVRLVTQKQDGLERTLEVLVIEPKMQ